NDGDDIGVETQQLFWALAIDLFAYSIKPGHGNPYDHPVYIFVSLMAFKRGSFAFANEHREIVCQLIFWGRASICLATKNVTDIMSQPQPDVVDGNNDNGNSSEEQDFRGPLQYRFTLQNRSTSAHRHLDLAIYKTDYHHDRPQDNPALVIGLVDIVDATRDPDDDQHNADIAKNDQLQHGLHTLLEDNHPTPVGSLFALNGLLSSFGDGYSRGPIVCWTPNSDYCQMIYKDNIPVDIKDLAHAYVDALSHIRQLLNTLLKPIKNTTLPPIKDLEDNCNEMDREVSFLNNGKNQLQQHKNTLFNSLVKSKRFRSSRSDQLNDPAMIEWMSQVAKLIEYFLFAMHLTGGQPARAPELNTLM
ncbi:hypothetical protein FBU31_007555, partial [Coemansia sp. 'formosensis']